jgi:hypothetical protein
MDSTLGVARKSSKSSSCLNCTKPFISLVSVHAAFTAAKLTGQGPAFDIFNYRPGIGYSRVNTRILRVYRGAGVTDPSGYVTTDDGVMCIQFGYTVAGSFCTTPIPFSESFTMHGLGDLPFSTYVAITPTGAGGAPPPSSQAQPYSPASTVTGLSAANYRGGWISGTHYLVGDAVYDPTDGAPFPLYVAAHNVSGSTRPVNDSTNWYPNGSSNGPVYAYKYVWQVNSTIFRPCLARGVTGSFNQGYCAGHEVHGAKYEYGDTLLNSHFWAALTIPSASNDGAVANPGLQLLYTNLGNGIPGDQHGTYRNAGATDTNPMGSGNTGVPTNTYCAASGGSGSPCSGGSILSSGYGEFVGIQTNGSGNGTPCTTSGYGCFYRFAHSYNDGLESNFSQQNNISVISQDGQWALIGTDMMGILGSISSIWQSGNYAIGSAIFPTNYNTGSYDYVATAIGGSGAAGTTGTTGGAEPHWDACAGTPVTCTDGSGSTAITWTRQAGACKAALSKITYAGTTYTNVTRWSPTPTPGPMSVGDIIYPVSNNTPDNMFMVLSVLGGSTPSGNPPTWDSVCGSYAQTCSYSIGGPTFVNIGPDDCRGDVMLVDLLSAH